MTGTDSRNAVFSALLQVYRGKPLDAALRLLERADDMAFARMLAMTVIRRNGEIESVINRFVQRLPKKLEAVTILKMGIAQLLFMATAEHAAINETVELVKKMKLHSYVTLVNAVLRNVQRQRETVKTDPVANLPQWLECEDKAKLAASILNVPPLDVTVRGNPEEWAKKLGGEVIYGRTVRLHNAGKIEDLPGYADGEWWVQDFSAALPATLFSNLKGKKVADFCAAPGGKTAQLVAMGADVTAFDISPVRIKVLEENLRRLKMQAQIVCGNPVETKHKFDSILLDAPCSATGTARKNPDILLKKNIKPPLKEQSQLLDAAWRTLNPGGEIVYSVCSILESEGEGQILSFLKRHPEARLVPITGLPQGLVKSGFLKIAPYYLQDKGGVDGFFAAKIAKN